MPIVAPPAYQAAPAQPKLLQCITGHVSRSSLVQWLFENGIRWSESFYASPGAIEVIFDLYSLHDPKTVWAYLELHREILPVLLEGFYQIQHRFGSGTTVILSVIAEPTNPGASELFALIPTSLSVHQAMQAMNKLDEEWWLDVPEHKTGTLNFDVKFV